MASLPRRPSLPRRQLLLGAGALALAGCRKPDEPITAAHTPALDQKRLSREVGEIAARLSPGVLGAGLMNLDSDEVWTFNGDRRFPLQSVFKAPLGAAVLAEVDGGRLSLDEPLTLKDVDLSPPWSPIAEAWPGRASYTARELFDSAVRISDNTAADVLMARIGGPGAVTAWLADKRIEEVRIDRYEREIQTEMLGLAPFRPSWRAAAFHTVLATVPAERQRQAIAAYLADPRDTATPRGMLNFLDKLHDGELLSPASRRLLLRTMIAVPTGANRLKAGLPKDASLAHKTGTGPVAQGISTVVNDVGIARFGDKRRYSMVVFLAGSTHSVPDCEAAIAEVARALVRGAR